MVIVEYHVHSVAYQPLTENTVRFLEGANGFSVGNMNIQIHYAAKELIDGEHAWLP